MPLKSKQLGPTPTPRLTLPAAGRVWHGLSSWRMKRLKFFSEYIHGRAEMGALVRWDVTGKGWEGWDGLLLALSGMVKSTEFPPALGQGYLM